MTISYAIPVCNEFVEIQKLIPFLLEHKRDKDQIVVLYDSNNGDPEVEQYLRKMNVDKTRFKWASYSFKGDFAAMKNRLNGICSGDYIFQIDADETPNKLLVANLPAILQSNPDNEVYLVPRINTVKGLTNEHVKKWGWRVDEQEWVNFPDYQWRIWKNKPEIKWKNKVHEVLEGHKTYAPLPAETTYALFHPKTIERQVKQNNYYDTL